MTYKHLSNIEEVKALHIELSELLENTNHLIYAYTANFLLSDFLKKLKNEKVIGYFENLFQGFNLLDDDYLNNIDEETFFYSCIKKYLIDHREQLRNITSIDGTFDQRGGNQYKGSIKFVFKSKNNKNDEEYCFHLDFLL